MLGRTHYKVAAAVYVSAICAFPATITSLTKLDIQPSLAGLICAALGGLFPDADHPNGMLYNWLPRVWPERAHKLFFLLGAVALCIWNFQTMQDPWLYLVALAIVPIFCMPHRSYTHSLEGAFVLCWAACYFAQSVQLPHLGVAFTLGYVSHILLTDILTVRGVMLSCICWWLTEKRLVHSKLIAFLGSHVSFAKLKTGSRFGNAFELAYTFLWCVLAIFLWWTSGHLFGLLV